MLDPCIALLRDLVAIDSVNPSLVPGAAGETDIADAVAAQMRAIGLDVELQEVADGRSNVVGVLQGSDPGPTLMFCGHLDTVGVEGMAAPFDPVMREGRLYGRGSQDMKGGIAAMIDAARLARDRGFRKGKLVIAAVIDEEYASLGADALVTRWSADAAVVTEPTDLQIGIGHKGFAWLEIETRGRAAHGSRPSEGRDAILAMGRVLPQLERLDRDLQRRVPHAVLGTGSLHASIIAGGRELSSYPDLCRLQVERRTVTGETSEQVVRDVHTILDALRVADTGFEASARLLFSRAPYEVPAGNGLPEALAQAAAANGLVTNQVGLSFWTDAAILGESGIPTVLFGPGGAGLHSAEEYVLVQHVVICRDVLVELVLGGSFQ